MILKHGWWAALVATALFPATLAIAKHPKGGDEKHGGGEKHGGREKHGGEDRHGERDKHHDGHEGAWNEREDRVPSWGIDSGERSEAGLRPHSARWSRPRFSSGDRSVPDWARYGDYTEHRFRAYPRVYDGDQPGSGPRSLGSSLSEAEEEENDYLITPPFQPFRQDTRSGRAYYEAGDDRDLWTAPWQQTPTSYQGTRTLWTQTANGFSYTISRTRSGHVYYAIVYPKRGTRTIFYFQRSASGLKPA